jgi:hypothetical protein
MLLFVKSEFYLLFLLSDVKNKTCLFNQHNPSTKEMT